MSTPVKPNLDSELGFASDEVKSDTESSSSASSSDDEAEKKPEPTGFFILQHRNAQENLKILTEAKLKLTEDNKKLKQTNDQLFVSLNRANNMSRTQVGILKMAQTKEMDDKLQLIDSLQRTISETYQQQPGGDNKTQGLRQMVDQIKKLSEEKRIYYEKSEVSESNLKLLQDDYDQLVVKSNGTISDLETINARLKAQLDPSAMAQRLNDAASANIEQLRSDNERLLRQLREAESSAINKLAGESSGVSSAEVAKLELQLRQAKNALEDTCSELDRIKQSSSGSEKDKAVMQQQLSGEMSQIKLQTRDLQHKIMELTDQLTTEQEAHKRTQVAMNQLRDGLKTEMDKIHTQQAAGEENKKSVEQRLQSSSQEAATLRAELQSEKASLQTTTAQLSAAHKEIKSLKEQIDSLTSDSASKIDAEKRNFEKKLAETKATAAADVEAARKKALDDVRDYRSRLDKLSTQVRPMVATLKVISAAYKALKRETTELQTAIAPTVKQIKRDLLQTLADVDRQYKEMLTKYRKEMALRKKLHNELVDLRGNIRVFCRVRPMIKEDGEGPDTKSVFTFDKDDDQVFTVDNKGKTAPFEMDTVFTPASTQEMVFNAANDLIVSVIDGYNVCIFAYGQTGSGKTFTMEGSQANPGLNRRALISLFAVCEERRVDWSYNIEVSVLEIYNEIIRDLLGPNIKTGLEIRHGKAGPYAEGLSTHRVTTFAEVQEKFDLAKQSRHVRSTGMNDQSSRSHAILIVTVTGTNLSTGTETRGKLNLIDLAGSERVEKSGALNDEKMFAEAKNINLSLSCLGDVIHALGQKQKHVPYRNSKLTHLLQDSLGGQAKTLMVVQCSPVLKNLQETMCSLGFAQRVRAVELGASKKTLDSAEVATLKKRIKELESGQ